MTKSKRIRRYTCVHVCMHGCIYTHNMPKSKYTRACMYACIYVCAFIHRHTMPKFRYTHAHVYICMCVCMHTRHTPKSNRCMYVCILRYTCVYVCMHACRHTEICTYPKCACVYTHTNTHVYTHKYTHIYTYILRWNGCTSCTAPLGTTWKHHR